MDKKSFKAMPVEALAHMAKSDNILKEAKEAILTEYFFQNSEDEQITFIPPTAVTPSGKRVAKTLVSEKEKKILEFIADNII